MHHASSNVIGSQGVESQSHHSMHDVYLQFPVYFTTICNTILLERNFIVENILPINLIIFRPNILFLNLTLADVLCTIFSIAGNISKLKLVCEILIFISKSTGWEEYLPRKCLIVLLKFYFCSVGISFIDIVCSNFHPKVN